MHRHNRDYISMEHSIVTPIIRTFHFKRKHVTCIIPESYIYAISPGVEHNRDEYNDAIFHAIHDGH